MDLISRLRLTWCMQIGSNCAVLTLLVRFQPAKRDTHTWCAVPAADEAFLLVPGRLTRAIHVCQLSLMAFHKTLLLSLSLSLVEKCSAVQTAPRRVVCIKNPFSLSLGGVGIKCNNRK